MTKQQPFKKEAQRLAKALGVKLEYSRVGVHEEVTVEAPPKMVWACTHDIHELVSSGNYGPWGSEYLYEKLVGDLKEGLAPCEIEDCEWCNEEAE